ncbi:hydrogenase maturation nickel metallochaperone HypA [Microaerobacter geothermalis]|uniref:hydrogenase maturation nickel metallochaperone HypA/HybF n=1 Tax=Microaerobacter geothermalis TaxID=674972 RepID=UPI001F1CF398|nr:hydrogenase maturation nickel metallochaperone HypA [Microaerobacter geothermalis]MCF6092737.1 hydrogenase maturation nickel metallochaperone HypA [Microaerobacter geothermalis]
MHEMALMGDILNLVLRDATQRGIKEVNRVSLTVGELSNAMPEALEMAFDIFKAQGIERISRNAQLTIIHEPAWARCTICEKEYKPDRRIAVCPSCSLPTGKLISGETLAIESYEGS